MPKASDIRRSCTLLSTPGNCGCHTPVVNHCSTGANIAAKGRHVARMCAKALYSLADCASVISAGTSTSVGPSLTLIPISNRQRMSSRGISEIPVSALWPAEVASEGEERTKTTWLAASAAEVRQRLSWETVSAETRRAGWPARTEFMKGVLISSVLPRVSWKMRMLIQWTISSTHWPTTSSPPLRLNTSGVASRNCCSTALWEPAVEGIQRGYHSLSTRSIRSITRPARTISNAQRYRSRRKNTSAPSASGFATPGWSSRGAEISCVFCAH